MTNRKPIAALVVAMLGILAFGLAMVAQATALANGEPVLYSVSPRDDILRTVDPATGDTLSEITMTLLGGTGDEVDGATGLAAHPVTGELWGLIKPNVPEECKGRLLGVIDPSTGIVDVVGSTGDGFAGIAFDASGTLYGVTGDGACDPESLYALSPTDATPTFLCDLPNDEGDGAMLAFNPDDDRLYYASGLSDPIFERIDDSSVDPCATTGIPLLPFNDFFGETFALTYWVAEGVFLWTENAGELYRATADGSEDLIFVGDLDHSSKGLAFVNPVTPSVSRVGGAAFFFSGGSDSSSGNATSYAFGIVSAAVIFAAGGWYVRRRQRGATNRRG